MATGGRRSKSTSATRSTARPYSFSGVDARTPDDRDGGRFSRSLAGKQDWYGVQGGIWKPARLEARSPVHLKDVEIQSSYDLARGTVTVKGRLSQPEADNVRVTLSRAGEIVAHGDFSLDAARVRGVACAVQPGPMVAGCPQSL